jgi:hypothetical protein
MSTTRNARGLRVTVRTGCARLLAHRLLTVGRNPRTGDTVVRLALPDRLKTAS